MLTAGGPSGCTAADTIEAIIAREIGGSSDVPPAAEVKKCDPYMAGYSEINYASKRPTAADTVDAIIASQVGVQSDGLAGSGVGWKKVGSKTSVCSDNTSDTLSADEGQRDEDETRPRRMRVEQTTATSIGSTFFPAVVDHERNGCGPPVLPTSSAIGPDMGIFSQFLRQGGNVSQLPQTKDQLSSFARHLGSSKSPDARHALANGNNKPVMPVGSLMASVLYHGPQTLRVRDVIHSAIEENLQNNSTSASLDNLYQLYSQNRGPLPVPRSAVNADMPIESAQDLSCRNRGEPRSAVGKVQPAPPNCVGSLSVANLLRAEKSPPPAHSHYSRPPVSVMQPPPPIIDRCQDPLYHLAEVAVQRGRVEVAGDRHRTSPTPAAAAGYSGQPVLRPLVHPTEMDRSDHGASARPACGSITLGTPRHLMAADALPRPLIAADGSHRNVPQYATKVSESLPTAPQVVEMAQEALRYLGQPEPSQRAVMERVMAQVAGSFTSSSNPSHTILMGDYVTAQQMQTSQYQQLTQVPNLSSSQRHHQLPPADHRTAAAHDHIFPRVPDLLNGIRMIRSATDVSVNHVPAVQNRPQLAAPSSSQFGRRSLTAANVIDAIITHQINKEAPPASVASTSTVLNRLPDPRVLSSSSHRVTNVNGSVQQDGSVFSTGAGPVVYLPRHSIAERLEKERSTTANSHPVAVTFRSQDLVKSTTSSVVQLVTRPFTLGEHIDKMIQKDFTLSVNDSLPPLALDTSRNGTCLAVLSVCLTLNISNICFCCTANCCVVGVIMNVCSLVARVL